MTQSRIPRAGRRIGYVLMALALCIAVAQRQGWLPGLSAVTANGTALILGVVGVMLVFTELMVRGLYAQLGAAQDRSEPVLPEIEDGPT